MTTLELLANVHETAGQLESARRAQDWLDAQSHALELARLFRQLQLEEKINQQLTEAATPESFAAWIAQTRKAIGV